MQIIMAATNINIAELQSKKVSAVSVPGNISDLNKTKTTMYRRHASFSWKKSVLLGEILPNYSDISEIIIPPSPARLPMFAEHSFLFIILLWFLQSFIIIQSNCDFQCYYKFEIVFLQLIQYWNCVSFWNFEKPV